MTQATTRANLIQEAATWMMRLSDEGATEADWTAWRQWTQQSDEHRKYAHLTESLTAKLQTVPGSVGRAALNAPKAAARRTALKTLAFLLLAAPTGYVVTRLPWQAWNAEYRSSTGEQRLIALPDGGTLTLDTASAANVVYDDQRRSVQVVAGRAYIVTAADSAQPPRPFLVQTRFGQVRALGTRFEVQLGDREEQVAVFEGAVEITPKDSATSAQVLQAGWKTTFTRNQVQPPARSLSQADPLWLQKRIQVDNVPLGQLIEELGRYRPGILRCDPDVAALPVSGTYRLDDTDLALRLLAEALPVRVTRRTAYWVTVGPR
ncbi:fec operon regulator FecR [Achromobacter sp. 2789STDY5608615]|uniref:FecR domain-containing protein n=1 Tax=Achromobacter sp. 2789STDY5608615 TaxID=1806492 RepID=UPI0006C1048D|nr:FecR domain-containing protein [Achromobacter sp. 2789STDY5608615]CUK03260.1 fec operon regulator FecR [Achromobacter sp. 2789STDY5608615]